MEILIRDILFSIEIDCHFIQISSWIYWWFAFNAHAQYSNASAIFL